MCETCGCGETGSYQINKAGQTEPGIGEHEHSHTHGHSHGNGHPHDHDHTHDDIHFHTHPHKSDESHTGQRILEVRKDILQENNLLAERNRGFFEAKGILCINLVSSPGSGKTTLLEKTIKLLKKDFPISVIEGDQQSMLDAERIAKLNVPTIQINTGTGCHLDAQMVNQGMKSLNIHDHSLLFIENVGNLVCPALFDLGETSRVLIMSVTEGEDKPLKYPFMFRSAQLCLINKKDLLPYVDFNVEQAKENARSINDSLEFLEVSATTGEGMDRWVKWLLDQSKRIAT